MLSVIIVNYKNQQKTIEYIQTELCKITIPHIIVVVNNAATCESNMELSEALGVELVIDVNQPINKDKRCYVVAHPDNLGYAKGNNLGVEFSIKHFDIDHLLISNNDISFIDSDVVEQLVTKISSLSNVGLIGPKVIGLDEKNQSPEPYVSLWKKYVWMYWLTPFLTKKNKTKLFKLNYSEKAKEGIHYKIMGSFFLAKKDDFIKCGMMDTNTFLYAEEIILSERLLSTGKYAYYFPDVSVIHNHSETISKYLDYKKKMMLQFESESYYYKKYRNFSRTSILISKISTIIYCFIKNKINKNIQI